MWSHGTEAKLRMVDICGLRERTRALSLSSGHAHLSFSEGNTASFSRAPSGPSKALHSAQSSGVLRQLPLDLNVRKPYPSNVHSSSGHSRQPWIRLSLSWKWESVRPSVTGLSCPAEWLGSVTPLASAGGNAFDQHRVPLRGFLLPHHHSWPPLKQVWKITPSFNQNL